MRFLFVEAPSAGAHFGLDAFADSTLMAFRYWAWSKEDGYPRSCARQTDLPSASALSFSQCRLWGIHSGKGTVTMAPSAGWYPSSGDPTNLRYWNGTQWTEHYAQRHQPLGPVVEASSSSPMKVAGAMVLALGLIIAALLCAIPTSISQLGYSESCGIPLIMSIVPAADVAETQDALPTAEACRRQSFQRVVAGVGVGGVGVVVGMIMMGSARKRLH
jgi:hypothetical protein